jgi:hypothetical protein
MDIEVWPSKGALSHSPYSIIVNLRGRVGTMDQPEIQSPVEGSLDSTIELNSIRFLNTKLASQSGFPNIILLHILCVFRDTVPYPLGAGFVRTNVGLIVKSSP